MFFIKSYKSPHPGFNITDYITFATGNTRLATHQKLNHTRSSDNITKNFYLNRLPRIWNHLPVINLDLSVITIKQKLCIYLWNHFLSHFNPDIKCTYSFLCPCVNCSKFPRTPNFDFYHNNFQPYWTICLFNLLVTPGQWYRIPVGHQCCSYSTVKFLK